MSSQILALVVLVALLGHVAITYAAPIADESLDAALETGPEISAAVENEYLEEDTRVERPAQPAGQPGLFKKRRCISRCYLERTGNPSG